MGVRKPLFDKEIEMKPNLVTAMVIGSHDCTTDLSVSEMVCNDDARPWTTPDGARIGVA